MAKPKMAACGCWLWCETCSGTGSVIEENILKTTIKECPECKGKPARQKYCAVHAKTNGFDVDWRTKK